MAVSWDCTEWFLKDVLIWDWCIKYQVIWCKLQSYLDDCCFVHQSATRYIRNTQSFYQQPEWEWRDPIAPWDTGWIILPETWANAYETSNSWFVVWEITEPIYVWTDCHQISWWQDNFLWNDPDKTSDYILIQENWYYDIWFEVNVLYNNAVQSYRIMLFQLKPNWDTFIRWEPDEWENLNPLSPTPNTPPIFMNNDDYWNILTRWWQRPASYHSRIYLESWDRIYLWGKLSTDVWYSNNPWAGKMWIIQLLPASTNSLWNNGDTSWNQINPNKNSHWFWYARRSSKSNWSIKH